MKHDARDMYARVDLPSPSRIGANGAARPALDPRRWLALAVVLVAGFMDLLDVTIVNVAIPTVLRDLRAEYAQVEWIVAGYVLGFAAVLITGGRLGDIFGRKRLFLIGVGALRSPPRCAGSPAAPSCSSARGSCRGRWPA
jgi:MFS family permease